MYLQIYLLLSLSTIFNEDGNTNCKYTTVRTEFIMCDVNIIDVDIEKRTI